MAATALVILGVILLVIGVRVLRGSGTWDEWSDAGIFLFGGAALIAGGIGVVPT
jgi:hypothetical protein